MSVRTVKAGSTDVSVVIRIVDSTDGTPETGVAFDAAGIDLWYRREGAASTDITEATLAALTTAHTDGGFLHVNDGWYRLDLPDAAVAAGVTGVQIGGTVTGMVVLAPYIELVAYDPTDTVRLGLTALPNAAAEAAGGLYTRGAGAGQINQPVNGMVDVNAVRHLGTAYATPTVAGVPEVDVTHIAGATTDVSALATNVAAVLVDTAEIGTAGAGLTNINLPNQTMDIVGNITGSLSGSVGSVAGSVGSVATGGITRATLAADTGLQTIRSGTAQAGGLSSITLDASASVSTDYYKDAWILLTGGTGVGQCRLITAYNGTTKVVTPFPNFGPAPDSTSTFAILPAARIVGLSAAGVDEIWDEQSAGHNTSGTFGFISGGTYDTLAFILSTGVLIQEGGLTANSIAENTFTAAQFAADVGSEFADAVWDEDATGHQTQGTFGQAIGDPGADSDTIFGIINAIGSTGAGLSAVPWNASWDAEVQSECADALSDVGLTTTVTGRIDAAVSTRSTPAQILTTALTESYAADGAAPTVTQALMLIQQMLTEITIVGTTMTVKQLDGSTTAATMTLNSSSAPTSVTRAT